MNLAPGQDVMLPRKSGNKKTDSDDTTESELITTETEESKTNTEPTTNQSSED